MHAWISTKFYLTHSPLGFWNGFFHLCIWAIPLIRKGCFTKFTSRVANSIDLDEMARYMPSHLDLCCLQISVKALLGMNELTHSPLGFTNGTLPPLNLGHSIDQKRDVSQNTQAEWQTALILLRWLITSHLIWIYAVCKYQLKCC